MLNPVSIGIAVGYAFLVGVPLLLLAFVWKTKRFASWRLLGVIFLFVFLPLTTPVPLWLHVPWGILLIGSLIAERRPIPVRNWWPRFFILVTLLAWGNEIRYQIWWPLPAQKYSRLVLVADSLTAGLGFGGEVIWPERLTKETGWEIVDLSQPGATLKSAQKQAALIPEGESLVLLEIGGNDLLEVGDPVQFERDLDQLLRMTCASGRQVLMFELPLPPLYQRFGAIQRRLAARYDVHLIPKRCFGSLLSPAGATVDGLHFSNSGHERVARFVHGLLAPVMNQGD